MASELYTKMVPKIWTALYIMDPKIWTAVVSNVLYLKTTLFFFETGKHPVRLKLHKGFLAPDDLCGNYKVLILK